MSREAHSLPLVLATAVLLSGCGLHGKPNVDRTKALAGSHVTAAVTAPDLEEPNQVVAPGVVEAWGGNVELSPGEPGWIAKILASEGGRVEARQVLATLDDEAQRASVDLAKADLAEAEATFAKTQNGATVEELRQARAENEAGQVRAELARHDATRSDRLGSDRVLAPAEVERVSAEARVQTAIANASAAKLASLERGSRSEDRSAGRNRVVAARARVALAEVGLARRQVVAPIAGVVLLSRFHVGEFFNVGGVPLFVLGDTSSLQVRLEVDEIDAFRVKDGAPCTLYGDDNQKIVAGAVLRLAPQMGRRGLAIESPTARADVRVREVFVEVSGASSLVPGQRVWGHVIPVQPAVQPLSAVEKPHVN
jgi:multidrug efflux pump subunit AcrA (membrane-fusion protein)